MDSMESSKSLHPVEKEDAQASTGQQPYNKAAPVADESTHPHHPEILPDGFPFHQHLPGRSLSFQTSWYSSFPWLHIANNVEGVSCYYCTKYFQSCKEKTLATKADMSFCGKGFRNWKKATEKFRHHEQSTAHAQAVLNHSQRKEPIEKQLSRHVAEQQKVALESLMAIISSVKYLLRQGLSIRGHTNNEGNFIELLRLRSEDKPCLREWLHRQQSYTHSDIQNEIIQILGNQVTSAILENIRLSSPFVYSVICDGTRDISGNEQECICIRWCHDDLEPQESFIGFYQTGSTTGEAIASLICDALVRLHLPLANLRGQTYDGAGNMSGHVKGAQSIIIEKQPLADYVHCGAHCSNLVMKDSCNSSPIVKNSMESANQLGILLSRTKPTAVFRNILEIEAQCPVGNIGKIRPLCPTRWIYRSSQIDEILKKYSLIIETLGKLSEDGYEGASSLLNVFENGATYLGLFLGKQAIDLLELLNKSFQGRKGTLAGLVKSVESVIDGLNGLRTNERFSSIYTHCAEKIEELGLEPLKLPRGKRPTKRLDGPAKPHEFSSCEEFYRMQYFQVLDTAVAGLQNRILHQKGVQNQVELEAVLIQGENLHIVEKYPEINSAVLEVELLLFRQKIKDQVACLDDVREALRKMTKEVRSLFGNIENLVRILLVSPASSCEAERSFSALRKLKSYMRSTMTQKRLNHVALCYVHQSILDTVDLCKVAETFILNRDGRRRVFGSVCD